MTTDRLKWERPRAREYVAYVDPEVRHFLARYAIRKVTGGWRLSYPWHERRHRREHHPTLAAAKEAANAHHAARPRADI